MDPFEEQGPVRQNTIESVRALQKRTGATIIPVHVFSVADLSLSVEATSSLVDGYLEAAKSALGRLIADTHLEGLEPGMIIFDAVASKSRAAEAISEFAASWNADLIIAGTHGRSGLPRLILGSFAESLVLKASVPVLIISHRPLRDTPQAWHWIYSTDLGQLSRRLFEQTVDIAQGLNTTLTVFHSIPNPLEPILQSGTFLLGGSWVPVHPYFAEDTELRRNKVKAWAQYATHHGVQAQDKVVENSASVSLELLQVSENENADLIVMAPRSGRFLEALAGSIVRYVARHSEAPFLILHRSAEKSVFSRAA